MGKKMSTSNTLQETAAPSVSQDDQAAIMQKIEAFGAAGERLEGWIAGAQALALLQGALQSGILDAVRTPSTPAEIAAAVGTDERRTADVCLALEAFGIVDRVGEAYRLSSDFAILAAPDALQSLSHTLGIAQVMARALAAAATAERAYTALPSEDALAVAKGVAPVPSSSMSRAFMTCLYDELPEVKSIMEQGGRWLELGCGAAGGIVTLLQIFPRMTAVGLEINDDVLEEARRRAIEMRVDDRVEFRHMDARDLQEDQAFDVAFWSQFFFPSATRAATLAVARRALKPGGYLGMPLLGEMPASTEALREAPGRHAAVGKLVYSSWRVPVRSAEELRAEVEAAGFEFVRVASFSGSRGLIARVPER